MTAYTRALEEYCDGLAQPATQDVDRFCDANCTWSDHHPDCKLAQPALVQEPVAWMDIDEKGAISGLRYWSEPDNRHEVALYTTPPQRTEERNFCPRCGKRTGDLTSIHTCTPPQEKYTYGTPLMDAMKGNT